MIQNVLAATLATYVYGFATEDIATSLETFIPSAAQTFQYHIGGFGGFSAPTANNIRTVTLDLAARGTAKVKASKVNGVDVHNLVDVNKVFTGVNTMNLTTSFNVNTSIANIKTKIDKLETLK